MTTTQFQDLKTTNAPTQFQDFKTTIAPTTTQFQDFKTTLAPTTNLLGSTTSTPNFIKIISKNDNENNGFMYSKDNTQVSNGFVDVKETQNHVPFSLYQEGENKTDFKGSLDGIITSTIVSEVFFSRKNIDNIQKNIIKGVLKKSYEKYKIGNQSEKELQIIMRSIYLQNSVNSDSNIQLQIKNLNNLVLDYCIPNILINVTQYIGYLKNIDTIPNGVPDAISDNIIGDKKAYEIPELLY